MSDWGSRRIGGIALGLLLAAVGTYVVACGSPYGASGGGADAGANATAVCAARETLCADKLDDDCDGLADCADPDCSGTPACPSPQQKGSPCNANGQCASGFCADGVCCDSACTGGDCDACTVALGARSDGTCTILPAGTACRPAAGACDAPETCDGASAACPPDALRPALHVCRPSLGACDAVESCTAGKLSCPADVITCSDAPCSSSLACTGLPTGSACMAGNQCRSSFCVDGFCCDDACNQGVCQACSVARGAAANGSCTLRAAGSACRASTGVCDAAEACSGQSAACPADAKVPNGTACGGGLVCSNGACVPPCAGAGCPVISTCTVSASDTSAEAWGQLNAPANKDEGCPAPAGRTVTYTDYSAVLDDGGTISVNGAVVFSGDNYACSIKSIGYTPITLPPPGAFVQIRALNCVTAGVGGSITIRFFGY